MSCCGWCARPTPGSVAVRHGGARWHTRSASLGNAEPIVQIVPERDVQLGAGLHHANAAVAGGSSLVAAGAERVLPARHMGAHILLCRIMLISALFCRPALTCDKLPTNWLRNCRLWNTSITYKYGHFRRAARCLPFTQGLLGTPTPISQLPRFRLTWPKNSIPCT